METGQRLQIAAMLDAQLARSGWGVMRKYGRLPDNAMTLRAFCVKSAAASPGREVIGLSPASPYRFGAGTGERNLH
jgi:hypothetical protein